MMMSTLLFPSDTIYDQIEGPIIGSMTTCRFQGFLILFSSQATIVYSVLLAIYFIETINGKLDTSKNMNRKIEISFNIAAVIMASFTAGLPLVFDLINPTPQLGWCVQSYYPFWCNTAMDEEVCSSKENRVTRIVYIFVMFTIALVYLIFAALMVKIVKIANARYLVEKERSETDSISSLHNNCDDDENQVSPSLQVRNQALLYMSAVSLSNIAVFLIVMFMFLGIYSDFTLVLELILPLHGVFNFSFYFREKLLLYKACHEKVSLYEAVKGVLIYPHEEEYVFSGLELIKSDEDLIKSKNKPNQKIEDCALHVIEGVSCVGGQSIAKNEDNLSQYPSIESIGLSACNVSTVCEVKIEEEEEEEEEGAEEIRIEDCGDEGFKYYGECYIVDDSTIEIGSYSNPRTGFEIESSER